MTDRLLTLRQASERLGCSYSFIFRAYKRGVLPVIKQGKFIRVSEQDLHLWIDARRIAQATITATADARTERAQRQRKAGLVPADDLRDQAA